MPATYRDEARALPIPTPAQALSFARYVAGVHSWYKRLSLVTPSPFTFVLDPNAGREWVRGPGGTAGFMDLTDQSQSRVIPAPPTTASWREEYGHWSYHAAPGAPFLVSVASGGWRVNVPYLELPLADGGRLPIDLELLELGTVGLTGLVYFDGDWENPGVSGDHTSLIQELIDADPRCLDLVPSHPETTFACWTRLQASEAHAPGPQTGPGALFPLPD